MANGTNIASINQGVVAQARVTTASPVSSYSQSATLAPNTDYVLSAYLWNMGDAANHVNTVIDFNDVPGEPQLVLGAGDSQANLGYFFYRPFNTGTTGTNILVRVFYDGLVGTGTAATNFPTAAQWDNIAITPLNRFQPPAAAGSKLMFGRSSASAIRSIMPLFN